MAFRRLLLFALISLVVAVNPVKQPIIFEGLKVFTKKVAKLPNFLGQSAKIVCIVPQGNLIYVCTLNAIYAVTPGGQVSEFMNVGNAISAATGRSLNFFNTQHGGVRGLAFHPSFGTNGLFYVSAMENRPGNPASFTYISDVPNPIGADSVLIEFKINPATGKPNAFSYRNVFRIGMPVYDHPIKHIEFWGPNLYIAHGDGSEQAATVGGGQNSDGLGKILRINPLKSGNLPYTIPPTNPFIGKPFMKNEVWAYGFRNPHTFCFSQVDGTMYIGETGRSNVEEVNIGLPGKNYGWSKREGTFVHVGPGLMSGIQPLPTNDAQNFFEYPAAQVGHDGPYNAGFIGQAIAGGCPVENGSPLSGNYFYSDFPKSGKLFYSKIGELKGAKTNGNPWQLTQAPTRQAVILYDHDGNPATPNLQFATLGDAVRLGEGITWTDRVDVRIGRGPGGALYWSSKVSGSLYVITNSL